MKEMFIQSRRLARWQSQIREQLNRSKVAGCSYTAPLKSNISYEPFSGKFLSNCSFMLLWVKGSERLRSTASLLKTKKASKDQKEILACALENGYAKTGKAQKERLCRSPVLETLSGNFFKTGLHRWYFPKNVPTFFGKATSQSISERLIRKDVYLFSKTNRFASARQLSRCNQRSTVIAFRILVKSHKRLEGTKPFACSIL